MSTNPLNDIAPYPRSVDEVTAYSLGRHLAVQAWVQRTHRRTATSGTDWEWSTSEIVNLFAIVWLLRALQAVAPETADEAAKDLWLAWEDGGALGEWLHAWLVGFGIDPARVDAVADELAREAA